MSVAKVLIHPLVPIEILNAHSINYNKDENLSFGGLLGISKDSVYDIRASCLVQPFSEANAADEEKYLQNVLETHQMIHRVEHFVGWFVYCLIFLKSKFFLLIL